MKLMALGIVSMSLSSAMAEEAPPRLDFAFEELVTLSPVVEMGETALGARRSIPITGGTVTGPKLKGVVQPGGWDFQLTYAGSHCTQLSADYFLKAEDGTPIHVLNEVLSCPGAPRPIFRPKLEAPQGKYEWMTHSTFVATLELEYAPGPDKKVEAVRIRFYQVS